MKLKQRNLTDSERRLAAVSQPMQRNQDRFVHTTLLVTVVFGVVALAVVAGYLIWLTPTLQDLDARVHKWEIKAIK
jgi:hypothetical protein